MSGIDDPSRPRAPQTLLEQLGPEIARIRGEVHGCVGTRPYRVFVVVRGWSGGEPGRGTAEELRRTELGCGPGCNGQVTPPAVVLSGGYARSMHGLVDPRYTEAQLVAYGRCAEDEEAFVEITQDGRDGDAADRPVRRFRIDGPPFRTTKPYGWVMRLRSIEPQDAFGPAQEAP
jgi:hypothetical protein